MQKKNFAAERKQNLISTICEARRGRAVFLLQIRVLSAIQNPCTDFWVGPRLSFDVDKKEKMRARTLPKGSADLVGAIAVRIDDAAHQSMKLARITKKKGL